MTRSDRDAVRLHKLAAERGNASAQYGLGWFYAQGRGGLAQDDREAARLFKLAADQGYVTAQFNLAIFYTFSRGGLPQDDREAARLYKLAADQGNAIAQGNLALMYENGQGVPQDVTAPAQVAHAQAMTRNECLHIYSRADCARLEPLLGR